jgi:hypothetical protein
LNLFNFLILVIAVTLFAIVWQMRKLNSEMTRIVRWIADTNSVHDATHPAFSIEQLRRARQRFEDTYKKQLGLQADLYESEVWRSRNKTEVSPQLRERLVSICEAIVHGECRWKEYGWMVEANTSVANGRASRTEILEGFSKLLERTRGLTLGLAPNPEKARRLQEVLTNWIARLTDSTNESLVIHLPNTAEETFDVRAEEERKDSALYSRAYEWKP